MVSINPQLSISAKRLSNITDSGDQYQITERSWFKIKMNGEYLTLTSKQFKDVLAYIKSKRN